MREGEAGVSLRAWLEARTPPPPSELLDRLVDVGAGPGPKSGHGDRWLVARAGADLGAALAGEGERRGAFRLLAADAWITWASEEALEGGDPTGALMAVVREILHAAEAG